MTSTPADYRALAEQATHDHTAANKRYQDAVRDSQLAAFAQLVFTAAAADVITVHLEPSDQGDYMTVSGVVGTDDTVPDVDEDTLEDGASDLPDTVHSYWAVLPGVAYESDRRYGDKATVDVHAAAAPLLEQVQAPTADTPAAASNAVIVREQEMVGKTIASVSTGEEQVRDTYDDEFTIDRTLLTFTDGTQAAFGEIRMDTYTID